VREALLDVTPSHRSPGRCWCGVGYDIEKHGHTASCRNAQAALALLEVK